MGKKILSVKDRKILYIRVLENKMEELKKDNNRMARDIQKLEKDKEELIMELKRLK